MKRLVVDISSGIAGLFAPLRSSPYEASDRDFEDNFPFIDDLSLRLMFFQHLGDSNNLLQDN
jgi:hypothetical protein